MSQQQLSKAEKLQRTQNEYRLSLENIKSSALEWQKFLDFVAKSKVQENMNGHEFSTKLLVYTTNPNATDFRQFGEWKDEPNNHVKSEQSGIRVLFQNEQNGKTEFKYLFDRSQTAIPEIEQEKYVLTANNRNQVEMALSERYGIQADNIENMIKTIVSDFSDNTNLSDNAKKILSASAEYKLCKQFGVAIDTPNEFSDISKLSIIEAGTIGKELNNINSVAKIIENSISKEINEDERNNNNQSRNDGTRLHGQQQSRMDLEQRTGTPHTEIPIQRGTERMVRVEHGEHDVRGNGENIRHQADSRDGQVRDDEIEIHSSNTTNERIPTDISRDSEILRKDERYSDRHDRGNSGEEKEIGGIRNDIENGELSSNASDTRAVPNGSRGRTTSDNSLQNTLEKKVEAEEVSAFSDFSEENENNQLSFLNDDWGILEENIYQVITYDHDSGTDEKMEYATLDEAIVAGREYLADDWDGFAVFNKKDIKVELYEGDFPTSNIFSEEVYKNTSPEVNLYTNLDFGDFFTEENIEDITQKTELEVTRTDIIDENYINNLINKNKSADKEVAESNNFEEVPTLIDEVDTPKPVELEVTRTDIIDENYIKNLLNKNSQNELETGQAELSTEQSQENNLKVTIGFTESYLLDKFKDETMNGQEISFALANSVVAYLDEKQHFNNVGYYDKTDITINAHIDGEEFNYKTRFDIGDGNGTDTGGSSIVEHIENFNKYILENNPYSETNEELTKYQINIDVLIPYLKENSQLTPKEQEIFDKFKLENPIKEIEQDNKIEPNSLIGKHYTIDEREFVVESVNSSDKVSLMDVELQKIGYPIFRTETVDFLLNLDKNEHNKQQIGQSEQLDKTDEKDSLVDSAPKEPKPKGFYISDDDLGVGGAKTRFKNNIEAIKTLKSIEQEERSATLEEKETMSKYVGWGGLSEAFDNSKSNWQNEYRELKQLLSEDEYEAALSTVNDAFYTSPVITKAIYEVLDNIGFKGGEILEPSMGIGNFFGTMPEEMRENSNLSGVEIDSISGRIAGKLYPEASVAINGFEKMKIEKNSFDVAVGNVPFGSYSLADKNKDYKNLLIHDYFFAKSIDSVRPGGVVAFVTSKGTLDKEDIKVRQTLAQKSELLGAIRLPDNAFEKNAGTKTTTDIIFLQKRDKPLSISEMQMNEGCDWVYTTQNKDGFKINNYFDKNPDMVLGNLETNYRGDTICTAEQDSDLKEKLSKAVQNIKGSYTPLPFQSELDELKVDEYLQATPDIENLTYTTVDDKLYFRVDDNLIPLKESDQHGVVAERRKGLSDLATQTRNLLQAQVENRNDDEIKSMMKTLDVSYEKFVKKHGRINAIQEPNSKNASGYSVKSANVRAFKSDVRMPLLQSLEKIKNGQFQGKSDIFTERTIRPHEPVTHVETSQEALILSVSERGELNFDYMMNLTDFSKEKIIADLEGDIFPVPELSTEDNIVYQTKDEYLSGDIYSKIAMAESKMTENPIFANNITALNDVIPTPLKATEIDMQLGMTWLKPELIQQFMYETFDTPTRFRDYKGVAQSNSNAISVEYSKTGKGNWHIDNAKIDNSAKSTNSYGTRHRNAYQILENILNGKSNAICETVRDSEGKSKTVILEKETKAVEEKEKRIKSEFGKWIFADKDRRTDLVDTYNRKFNCIRPREYDGSNLNFYGSNPNITLKPHQKNAISHALFGGNTLFAHQVGAGKTFEMIATAMEGKRLGLHTKSMFVVPNHLTEQIGSDFMKLYANANILVAKQDDFSPQKRRQMCARIATGNFDAVIIGHSQLMKIPLSPEREQEFIKNQISEITESLQSAKERNAPRYSVKELEKTKKSLSERLEKLVNSSVKDNAVTFEELGVDKLFVDEAHEFKNLFVATKMESVAGLSTSENVQKTQDLYMKCQYLDEKTNNKGIVFSTGTPVTNALSEMFTTMKYLQSDLLKKTGLDSFDSWAGNFTRKSTEAEISPSGTDWKMKTRLKFTNVPELKTMFMECADIKMADQLQLDVPECQKNIVSVKPTELQKSVVQSLSERAEKVHNGEVNRTEDNMLVITGDGRKLGLDQRLYDVDLPDEETTKINACVNNVFDIWDKTAENKSTQLVFCDLGVPQSKEDIKKNGERLDVYVDVREKLIEKGIPKEEIAFIHEANSELDKAKLFEKVRNGDVRVLIGSTQKMGAGTNVQNKLIASHDLDCPWRPSDLTQRLGRMVRQGNENKEVQAFSYVTEGTFDAYLYQMVEKKQQTISQIFSSKPMSRSYDDIDDASLDFMQVKIAAVGDGRIKEQMELQHEIDRLKMLKNIHTENKFELENQIDRLPISIENAEKRIMNISNDIKNVDSYVTPKDIEGNDKFVLKVKDKVFENRKEAGEAFKEEMQKAIMGNTNVFTDIAEYKGFKVSVMYDSFSKGYKGQLKGNANYTFDLGVSETGNMTRLDNAINLIPKQIDIASNNLERLRSELTESKEQIKIPFEYQSELDDKIERLEKLTNDINSDLVKVKQAENVKSDNEIVQDTKAEISNKNVNIEPTPKAEQQAEKIKPISQVGNKKVVDTRKPLFSKSIVMSDKFKPSSAKDNEPTPSKAIEQ